MRPFGALATLLLLAAGACSEQPAPETAPPQEDPIVLARAEARRSGRELLLSIRRDDGVFWTHEEERREAIARVVGSGAELGVVPLEMEVVEARSSLQALPAPDWLEALCLPVPGLGSMNDEPMQVVFDRLLPLIVFADADFRPIATWDEERFVAADTARAAIEQARATRRRRDVEFVMADLLDGSERAAALQRGLALLDRWIVVRSYAAELEELVETGDEAVRSWAEPLLREHRILRACVELDRAKEDLRTISPRRLSEQLAPVVRRYADVPEVAMLAACLQGGADLRLVVDDSDTERIRRRVEAASARCGSPWRGIATMWLRQL